MDTLPLIAVIGTGGTISSLGAGPLDVLDYPEFGQKLDAAALLDRFPEVRLVARTLPIRFAAVGSTAIGPAEWHALRTLIDATVAAQPELAGIVITHGTASLEETAFYLTLTLAVDVPVVLTAAQRPASALGSDAGMNLVAALRVAGNPDARGKGVLIVLNDEVHAARDVVKTATYRVQTFRSFDWGALGCVDGDGVHFFRTPLGRHAPDTAFTGDLPAALPRVDIVLTYAGVDGALVDAAVAAGARGLVSAAMAPGIATPLQTEALRRAAEAGVVVVQCSRAATGRVGRRRALVETGFVPGNDFSPQKARILLMLLLAQGASRAVIAAAFEEY